jgi:type I restriction enzyme S subunit
MSKARLSEIANIVMGQSPKGETCNIEGIGKPLLNGPTEFGDFYPTEKQYTTAGNKFSVKGDILFCVRGSTTGRMNWADKVYVLGRGLASIRHKKGNSFNYYLKYLIDINLNSILKSTSGSTFPNLTSEMLNSFELNVLTEQKALRVNDFLKSLDAKIELNNKINRELEATAKTLYDYWFVQFDFPNEQGKPYKSSGGKMVFNAELKREIPEGWEVDNLLKLSNLESGGTPSKKISDYWNGEIPFYTPSDYSNSLFVMETEDSISNTGLLNCSSKLYPKGTIFITARGTVGNVNVASKNMSLNQSCYAFITIEGIHYSFLYFSVKSQIKTLKAKSGGSVFNSVVTNDIKQAKLPIPPKKTIQSFTKICSLIFEKIFIISLENQQLTELRDWLLPMLMNGQVVSTSSTTDVKEDVVNLRLVAEPGGEYKTSSLA